MMYTNNFDGLVADQLPDRQKFQIIRPYMRFLCPSSLDQLFK